MVALATAAFALLALSGCGGSETVREERERVSVRFEYRASTASDPEIIENWRGCAELVGRTHLHGSWFGFNLAYMSIEGPMLWSIEFDDVPVGYNRIRVSDANACPQNPTGAVTDQVGYANGTLLTVQVNTPGNGIEPGFVLNVAADGTVSP